MARGHVSIQILSVGGAAVKRLTVCNCPPGPGGRGIGSASKDQNPFPDAEDQDVSGKRIDHWSLTIRMPPSPLPVMG